MTCQLAAPSTPFQVCRNDLSKITYPPLNSHLNDNAILATPDKRVTHMDVHQYIYNFVQSNDWERMLGMRELPGD